MKYPTFMLIAGEPSGDILAAELVQALRNALARQPAFPTTDLQPLYTNLAPRFFGAGGPRMAAAGVDLSVDMTAHAVTGLTDVLKNLAAFWKVFRKLRRLAFDRQPETIVCVDFSGFNRRFARSIRSYTRGHTGWFHPWQPTIVQYVSPQVWASRPGRAVSMAWDYDLLLSIIPFEKAWYEKAAPSLPVEFVGHPLIDRYHGCAPRPVTPPDPSRPRVLLLPGSRAGELRRHLPVMLAAVNHLRSNIPGLQAAALLPNESLLELAKTYQPPAYLRLQIGGLPEALTSTDVAIASTGTVTLECAYFGVPLVAMYRTSWATYQIGKRIATVQHMAMPNLLAGKAIVPEFIQDAATPEAIASAARELLETPEAWITASAELAAVAGTLGQPGASARAAEAILRIGQSESRQDVRR